MANGKKLYNKDAKGCFGGNKVKRIPEETFLQFKTRKRKVLKKIKKGGLFK